MITKLKELTAVKFGEKLLIQLSNGTYRVDGIESTIKWDGQQVQIEKDSEVYKGTTPNREKLHYTSKEGDLSVEEYDSRYNEYYGKYHNYEAICYPDLETEYECKKKMQELNNYTPVYNSPEIEWELLEYETIGELIDTGSTFITTCLELGQVKWDRTKDGTGVFRVDLAGAAHDKWVEMSTKYVAKANFTNSRDRMYLRFAQVDDSYIFGDFSPFKSGSASFHTTLEEAVKAEEGAKKAVVDIINKAIFPIGVNNVLAQKLFREISSLKKRIQGIDSKVKTQKEYKRALVDTNEILNTLDEYIKEHIPLEEESHD